MLEIDVLPASSGERGADSILLRFESGRKQAFTAAHQKIVLIDGGYRETAPRIATHVQQIYKSDRIHWAVCTHPDADHINGIIALLEDNLLTIDNLCVHDPWKHAYTLSRRRRSGGTLLSDAFSASALDKNLTALDDLLDVAARKSVHIHNLFAGSTIFDALTVLGPTQEYYRSLIGQFPGMPDERTLNHQDLVEQQYDPRGDHFLSDPVTSAKNDSSMVLLLNFEGHRVLFTGDCGVEGMRSALQYAHENKIDCAEIDRLQIPHHGSIKNLDADILYRLMPKQAFVSAPGQSDKHPSRLILNYLTHHLKISVYHCPTTTLRLSHQALPRNGWNPVAARSLFPTVFLPR
jgi:beta-lactamase superfamily II metal-dependent hydrolase